MGIYNGRVSAVNGITGQVIFNLEGSEIENLYGRSVCGLGDVDADGVGDLAVGAPHDNGGALDGGRFYLYRGAIPGQCQLALDGAPHQGASLKLWHMAHPGADSLVLVDLDPGPIAIPPYGHIALGMSPALQVLNDSLGVFGVPFGPPIGAEGLASVGPFLIPPSLVGMTVHLQAFALLPAAPNGLFQESPGLSVTFIP